MEGIEKEDSVERWEESLGSKETRWREKGERKHGDFVQKRRKEEKDMVWKGGQVNREERKDGRSMES